MVSSAIYLQTTSANSLLLSSLKPTSSTNTVLEPSIKHDKIITLKQHTEKYCTKYTEDINFHTNNIQLQVILNKTLDHSVKLKLSKTMRSSKQVLLTQTISN